ncbi:tRNA-dihydrouridine synthase [Candidatus Saccharibacteria bacterium oral taxon 955]|nr:tRNA-dihydrouridine synthase [Candidatus Saccharibacteria bacterium oral taxon 955]QJU05779.1 tRNA-dihydrouridine synthase [Candidatus Saccharibacteria bacterium oral taxon 955]
MMKSFWDKLPKPFFVLAPMEAVTDVVFRHVVTHAGRPDVYFSEFTNATGWFRAGDKAIGGRLIKTDDESPIVAQLWGGDPKAMEAMSQYVARLNYDGIDINMGCPDQSAIKGGGGADMIRNPDRASAIIAAAKTSGLPVSVKTRLGYTYVDEWRSWLRFLLEQDIVALTIHLRTKKEMSKVDAHFELIPEIKALRDEVAPDTLLIINGDILDREQGMKLFYKCAVDGIMIGRGVFQNPSCFRDDLKTEECSDRKAELIKLLHYHLDQFDHYQSLMGRPFETLKRFFKIYIRDFEGASDLRDKLMHTNSTDEVRSILRQLK